jgi:hypothetical protein
MYKTGSITFAIIVVLSVAVASAAAQKRRVESYVIPIWCKGRYRWD